MCNLLLVHGMCLDVIVLQNIKSIFKLDEEGDYENRKRIRAALRTLHKKKNAVRGRYHFFHFQILVATFINGYILNLHKNMHHKIYTIC